MPTRVLIADDGPVLGGVLARFLGDHGFQVAVAGTALEAVDALDEARGTTAFRHVILDIKLGDEDGENVLAHCERMPESPNVIVMAAPQSIDGHRMVALRGRCEYLPKPIIAEALLVMLRSSRRSTLDDYAANFELSVREKAVLRRAVEGLDDREISTELGCSKSTTRTYWARISEKIGVRSRDGVMPHLVRWLTVDREVGRRSFLERRRNDGLVRARTD